MIAVEFTRKYIAVNKCYFFRTAIEVSFPARSLCFVFCFAESASLFHSRTSFLLVSFLRAPAISQCKVCVEILRENRTPSGMYGNWDIIFLNLFVFRFFDHVDYMHRLFFVGL